MIWILALVYVIIGVLVRINVKESYFLCIFWPITAGMIALANLLTNIKM
jgi:hypothetical protein